MFAGLCGVFLATAAESRTVVCGLGAQLGFPFLPVLCMYYNGMLNSWVGERTPLELRMQPAAHLHAGVAACAKQMLMRTRSLVRVLPPKMATAYPRAPNAHGTFSHAIQITNPLFVPKKRGWLDAAARASIRVS